MLHYFVTFNIFKTLLQHVSLENMVEYLQEKEAKS